MQCSLCGSKMKLLFMSYYCDNCPTQDKNVLVSSKDSERYELRNNWLFCGVIHKVKMHKNDEWLFYTSLHSGIYLNALEHTLGRGPALQKDKNTFVQNQAFVDYIHEHDNLADKQYKLYRFSTPGQWGRWYIVLP